MNWFVRRATESDVEEISQVINDDYFSPFIALATSQEIMTDLATNKASFVAVHDAKIVGAVLCHDATICSLRVNPEFRRQGIGTELMKNAIKTLRPQTILLCVDSSNEAAVTLYKKLGFVKLSSNLSMMTMTLFDE